MSRVIGGEASSLDVDLKKALATWLFKTALLVPLALSARTEWPPSIKDQCRDLYVLRRPPGGARVWMGRYDLRDNFPELVGRTDLSELRYRRRGQDFEGIQILITLGYFMGIVVFWHGWSPDEVNIADRPEDRLLEIWPARFEEIAWPPEHTFTYDELSSLSNMVPLGS